MKKKARKRMRIIIKVFIYMLFLLAFPIYWCNRILRRRKVCNNLDCIYRNVEYPCNCKKYYFDSCTVKEA
jgi:hypothetical protein